MSPSWTVLPDRFKNRWTTILGLPQDALTAQN